VTDARREKREEREERRGKREDEVEVNITQ
jgi:hypothetical protein